MAEMHVSKLSGTKLRPDEYVLQLAVYEDRIILQVTKAKEERGKCATSNANWDCSREHYNDKRLKSEHENTANEFATGRPRIP